jgi:hypothetical protein
VSIDRHLAARWSPAYDCLAFAADIWRDATGEDLRGRLDGLFTRERVPAPRHFRAFERLAAPASPCLVLMRRPRAEPHLGVFLRGRVAHLTGRGAVWLPLNLACFGYPRVEFFR